MKTAEILERATKDGLTITLSNDGNIEMIGDEEAVNNWMETIRENKAAILEELLPTQAIGVQTVSTPLDAGLYNSLFLGDEIETVEEISLISLPNAIGSSVLPIETLDPVTVTGKTPKPAPALESEKKLSTVKKVESHDATPLSDPSDRKYSATVTDASSDPVLVEVTIAGQASFTLEIPHKFYDGIALLELLEHHNAQAEAPEETHSVMSGLSKETQGIEHRRAA